MVRQAAKAIAEHLRLAEQRRKQEEAKAAAVVKASAAASKPQAAANATLHTESASSALSEKAAEAEPVGAEDAEAERPSDRNPTEELMERLLGLRGRVQCVQALLCDQDGHVGYALQLERLL